MVSYGEILDNSATPLVQNKIAPTGLPAPYGSAQDARTEDVTQLHAIDALEDAESATEYLHEYLDARPDSETPRFTPKKQLFFFQAAVGIDVSTDVPFKAQSIRVDNYTNNWLYIPQLHRWIPPDWYGAVFTATGLLSISVLWQSPPGLVQPAATVNTIATIIAYLERLPEIAGTKRV